MKLEELKYKIKEFEKEYKQDPNSKKAKDLLAELSVEFNELTKLDSVQKIQDLEKLAELGSLSERVKIPTIPADEQTPVQTAEELIIELYNKVLDEYREFYSQTQNGIFPSSEKEELLKQTLNELNGETRKLPIKTEQDLQEQKKQIQIRSNEIRKSNIANIQTLINGASKIEDSKSIEERKAKIYELIAGINEIFETQPITEGFVLEGTKLNRQNLASEMVNFVNSKAGEKFQINEKGVEASIKLKDFNKQLESLKDPKVDQKQAKQNISKTYKEIKGLFDKNPKDLEKFKYTRPDGKTCNLTPKNVKKVLKDAVLKEKINASKGITKFGLKVKRAVNNLFKGGVKYEGKAKDSNITSSSTGIGGVSQNQSRGK